MKRRDFLRGLAVMPAAIKAAIDGITVDQCTNDDESVSIHSPPAPTVNLLDWRNSAEKIETLAVLDEDGDLWVDPDWNMTIGASATLRPFGDDDTYFTLEKA